jgi:ABC-type amino acid transport substrate-binding protein
MKRFRTPAILTALILGLHSFSLQGADAPSKNATLKVGVYVDDPFVIANGKAYRGFCIDLWKEVAGDLGRGSEYIPFASIPELLEAVSSGKADIGVSGTFVTEKRLQTVEFSQPFLSGGLQVMVHEKRGSSLLKLWNGLKESGHLEIFAIGLAVIMLGTIILTVAERHWNSEFHKDWANGLADSFYHVMSIVMTGKSSHKGLPGPWGRVLAGIWIAFGVGVVAYITSSVTSIMTVNRLEGSIRGPQDLPGHRIGVIPGTVGAQYCADRHLLTSPYPSLSDAATALVNRQVDAIVLDAMTLQWYDHSHPELPITEVGSVFDKKPYAFALPIGTPLRHEINRSIVKQNESGFIETLRKQYFGDIQ